ncbi:four helix bundle protein [Candidatus Wolfebacteria bacterium CG10_big_fil_rev_8_21_14_0_10_31_9]|uniref:Four helix bundle protein n=1 Tax=Candidatus Wolfebacteria bacterium CG10_big_fil_rev_8_21_14_0_10_31_9 TaxID=1975070 RepID=A0A2H0REW0_9BACT|nr:MAG: four helix bundle protein [Candidatus Wolfebacteria bacterium CG10_big_fil_rev_8_21_14_0_10_31_9]
MYFKFEKLEVWKLARKFAVEIYKLTRKFPRDELFGLVSQIRRATISVMLNIAEGSNRKSDADFRRFLLISLTSLEEVVSGFYIALDQNFINQREFDILYIESNKLASKLSALIKSLEIKNG